jgi:hypothetical protein
LITSILPPFYEVRKKVVARGQLGAQADWYRLES